MCVRLVESARPGTCSFEEMSISELCTGPCSHSFNALFPSHSARPDTPLYARNAKACPPSMPEGEGVSVEQVGLWPNDLT